MSAHTPGPWIYVRRDEWSHSVATQHGELPDGSPNYWTVASINKNREPEHEANARLIAAAPDLLEVLREFEADAWDGCPLRRADDRLCQKARAAIAKAVQP